MPNPPISQPIARLTVIELILWVAGIAAFAGLVSEIVRRGQVDQSYGLILVFLLIYVLYLSVVVPQFWNAPRVMIPATLLISSALWTLAIQFVASASWGWSVATLLGTPLITAFLIARLLPQKPDFDGETDREDSPSPVRLLLIRGKRLGRARETDSSGGWPEI